VVEEYDWSVIGPSYRVLENATAAQVQRLQWFLRHATHPSADRTTPDSRIHSVGVDRIVSEAQVTRATFYRRFPSKEDLVLAYLEESHRSERDQADAAFAAELPPADTLRKLSVSIAQRIQVPGFRGSVQQPPSACSTRRWCARRSYAGSTCSCAPTPQLLTASRTRCHLPGTEHPGLSHQFAGEGRGFTPPSYAPLRA
jgi:hypothetical protein